jgi:hypothetical protein
VGGQIALVVSIWSIIKGWVPKEPDQLLPCFVCRTRLATASYAQFARFAPLRTASSRRTAPHRIVTHIYMCVCIYVWVCVCLCICVCMYMCGCVYIYIYTYIYIYIYIYIYVYICIYVYMCIYVHTPTHIYAHTYIHVYMFVKKMCVCVCVCHGGDSEGVRERERERERVCVCARVCMCTFLRTCEVSLSSFGPATKKLHLPRWGPATKKLHTIAMVCKSMCTRTQSCSESMVFLHCSKSCCGAGNRLQRSLACSPTPGPQLESYAPCRGCRVVPDRRRCRICDSA